MEPIESADITLRSATLDDAESIVRIFAYYAKNTDYTFDSIAPRVSTYSRHMEELMRTYPFIVVCDGSDRVMGYSYAGPVRTQAAYAWDVETTIYLDVEVCGCGLGSCLYRALLSILEAQGFANAYAVLAGDNTPSAHMHEHLGFRNLGTIPETGYKFGQWRDVAIYGYHLRHPRAPEPTIPYPLMRDDETRQLMEEAVSTWKNGR